MYRFKSIKYLSVTGIMTSILFLTGYLSSLIFGFLPFIIFGNTTTFQLFDVIFIVFTAIFKGPMLLFAGPLAGIFFDVVSGIQFIVIPATILIRIMMFFVIKLLINQKWWSAIYAFFLASLILALGYPAYYLLVYQDQALALRELIVDSVQGAFAFSFALTIYYYLRVFKSDLSKHFWNDAQFNYLKVKELTT